MFGKKKKEEEELKKQGAAGGVKKEKQVIDDEDEGKEREEGGGLVTQMAPHPVALLTKEVTAAHVKKKTPQALIIIRPMAR